MSGLRLKGSYLAGLLAAVMFLGVWLAFADKVEAETQAAVTGSGVNIRSGPGIGYSKVGLVNKGDVFTVIGDKAGWYRLKLSTGQTGWIIGNYVKVTAVSGAESTDAGAGQKTLVVNVDSLNVRNGPGTNYSKTTLLNKGTQLAAIKQSGDWYYVSLGSGRYGWIAGWLVTVKTTAPVVTQAPSRSGTIDPPPSQVLVDKIAFIRGTKVNVRVAPGTDYGIVGEVRQGDRVPALESRGDWIKVRLPDGLRGWIANWLMTLEDLPPEPPPAPPESSTPDDGPTVDPNTTDSMPPYEILGVEAGKKDNGDDLLVIKSGGVIEYSTFILQAPDRLVIDIKDSSIIQLADLTPNGLFMQTVRTAQFSASPMVVRIVLDLKRLAAFQPMLSEDRKTLTVSLSEPSIEGKVIVIDPGHGGYDPGALGVTGLEEKEFNLKTALLLRDKLVQLGARVILTRNADSFIGLTNRADVANSLPADIFVSIHANYSERSQARGTSTYYYAPAFDALLAAQAGQRQKLAKAVQGSLMKNIGTNDMGVLQANFSVLRNTQMPSILVESAFLSNAEDEALLKGDAFRDKVAQGIAAGILEYFAVPQL